MAVQLIRVWFLATVFISFANISFGQEPGAIVPLEPDIPFERELEKICFSPDSKSLLFKVAGIVWLCDVAKPGIRAPGIQGPNSATGADRPPNTPPTIGDTSLFTADQVYFAPDSKSLMVVSRRSTQRWDVLKGTSLKPALMLPDFIGRGALNPVTGDVFVVSLGTSYAIPTRPQPAPVIGLAINPNTGKKTSKSIAFETFPWPGNRDFWYLQQMEYSPDGKLLVVVHRNGMVRLFDVGKAKELVPGGLRPAQMFDSTMHCVWSPDGKRLLVHGERDFELWDPVALQRVGDPIPTIDCSNAASTLPFLVSFSADSATIAAPKFEAQTICQEVQFINAATGEAAQPILPRPKDVTIRTLRCVQYVGDKLLVIREGLGRSPRPISLCNPTTGAVVAQSETAINISRAVVSPDGKFLATECPGESGKRFLRMWKLP